MSIDDLANTDNLANESSDSSKGEWKKCTAKDSPYYGMKHLQPWQKARHKQYVKGEVRYWCPTQEALHEECERMEEIHQDHLAKCAGTSVNAQNSPRYS